MPEAPERGPRPPDVDVRLLALVVALVVAAGAAWATYRDPRLGAALAVGLTALLAVWAVIRRGGEG